MKINFILADFLEKMLEFHLLNIENKIGIIKIFC
jgi:hypothetical protein